jgi:phosphopantetheine--protein transferase-like protein
MKLYVYDNRECEADMRHAASSAMFRASAADYLASADYPAAASVDESGDGILRTSIGPHGKPYFAAPPLRGNVHFSISHSGAFWAVLFHNAEVGLDIEDLRVRKNMTRRRMDGIAARFFAEGEREFLGACADHEYLKAFFSVWTSKEAYIKYTGKGMSQGLSSFSVFDLPDGAAITTLTPLPGIVCACCSAGAAEPDVIIPARGGTG